MGFIAGFTKLLKDRKHMGHHKTVAIKIALILSVIFASLHAEAETEYTLDDIIYTLHGGAENYAEVSANQLGYSWETPKNIVIPDSVPYKGDNYPVMYIGECAFQHCGGIKSLSIPSSVIDIKDKAFWNCYNMETVEMGGSVKTIGSSAFRYCKKLKSIVFSESLIDIGEYAFSECESLKSVVLPNSMKTVGMYAFNWCGVETVEIPNSVVTIEASAFSCCRKLKEVRIPDSVTSIGSFAFHMCDGLTSLEIPNSVTSLGSYAFCDCEGLESVIIGNGTSSIEMGTFYGCTKLKSIVIPNTVEHLGASAFERCGFISFTIPATIQNIESNPFVFCEALVDIDVDKDNQWFKSYDGCLYDYNMSMIIACPFGRAGNFEIPDSVRTINENAFKYCKGLVSVSIPDAVESICSGAFDTCESLESAIIPESVRFIGYGAFNNCERMKLLEIPGSVREFGFGAFSWCKALESVVYKSNNPIGGDMLFSEETYNKAVLTLGSGGLEKARDIEPWKSFKKIVGMEISEVEDISSEFSDSIIKGVYSMDGVRVGDSTDGLPSGLYIVSRGGKTSKVKVP